MLLNQTTIGELYQSLSAEELKELELYIRRQTQGKSSILYQLHRLMKDAKAQGKLGELDYNYIKAELFDHSPSGTTKLTTYTHLLINQIKEFLLLSKIKEKNIYTETLWGEILIERRLKRNILLKISQFKVNLIKDQYPIQKIYYNSREIKFYNFFNYTKTNILKIFESIKNEYYSLENLFLLSKLELFSSYISNHKVTKEPDSFFNKIINDDSYIKGISSENILINLNALLLSLIIKRDHTSYEELSKKFIVNFDEMSYELRSQIFPTLVNFAQDKIIEGASNFDYEIYRLLNFLNSKKLLFSREYITLTRFNLFITYEIKFGKIENIEDILKNNLSLIQSSQRDSFYNLNFSKLEFAKGHYKEALRHISSMNPSDSLYFFPQYKIMLIKCHVMLEDIDRVQAEKDNFYKYIYNNKSIPEDAQHRHKLFIKYAEYLIDARYEFLTDYMRRRIEMALLPSSPYFTEKPWMRERWNQLKEKYQK